MKPVFRVSVFLLLIVFASCKEKSGSNNYYDATNYIVKDTIFDKRHRLLQINYVNKYDDTRELIKRFYSNGNIKAKGFFHINKKEGPFTFYYPNGSKIFGKEYFKNDFLNGKAVLYHENGEIDRIMYYKMGKETGTWKTFDTTGHLIDSTVYQ